MSLWFRLVPKLAPKGLGDFFHGILHESHGSAHWVWADGFGSVSLPSVDMNLGLLLPRHPCRNPVLRADISILPVETLSSLYTPTWLGLGDFVKRGFSQSQGQTDQKPEDTAPPPPPEPCDVRPDLRGFSELFPDLLGKGSGARVTRRIVPVGM